jgi:uncharacterized protein YjbJ (UPF0337 family)
MNWDRMEGQWKQRRGKAVHHWGTMMNDELAAIAGKYEELVGGLQEKYGIAREGAELQVGEFKRLVEQLKQSNNKLIAAQKKVSKRKKTEGKHVKPTSTTKTKRRSKRSG